MTAANWIKVDASKLDPDTIKSLKVWEPIYKNVLDYGFIGLIDFMGEDASVTEAAKVSYGKGTKSVNSNEGLIRYLMRKFHSSPTEMIETKWHIKCPIFVARQILRHRTFSVNEISGRYSVMEDEMYIPDSNDTAPQSTINNQGRLDQIISDEDYAAVRSTLEILYDNIYQGYLYLSGPDDKVGRGQVAAPDIIQEIKNKVEEAALKSILEARRLRFERDEDDFTDEEVNSIITKWLEQAGIYYITDTYPGIARELARIVLPLSTYTQFYWKGDLHNLYHFIRLRADSHAQKEVRVYADVMMEIIDDLYPISTSAFRDYRMHSKTLSRMEMNLLGAAMRGQVLISDEDAVTKYLMEQGCSKREIREFIEYQKYDHT